MIPSQSKVEMDSFIEKIKDEIREAEESALGGVA